MNFLAHIFLSGSDEELMVGNFIADFVKGNRKNDFPAGIRKGIELHRAIDDYTDHHIVTSESKKRLYPSQHKYASVVVDLFYDHFLAADFSSYSNVPLDIFAANTYQILQRKSEILPQSVKDFLPYMIQRNWLLSYSTVEGIGRTLTGLSKRVAFPNKMDTAIENLRMDYPLFKSEFDIFFPQLVTFAGAMKI